MAAAPVSVFNPGGGLGSTSSSAPAAPKRVGMREQSRKMLADAIAEGGTCGNEPQDPAAVAEAIEGAIFALHPDEKTKEYRTKLRNTAQSLKGARNASLRKALLHGSISAQDLVTLDGKGLEEMAKEAIAKLPPSAPGSAFVTSAGTTNPTAQAAPSSSGSHLGSPEVPPSAEPSAPPSPSAAPPSPSVKPVCAPQPLPPSVSLLASGGPLQQHAPMTHQSSGAEVADQLSDLPDGEKPSENTLLDRAPAESVATAAAIGPALGEPTARLTARVGEGNQKIASAQLLSTGVLQRGGAAATVNAPALTHQVGERAGVPGAAPASATSGEKQRGLEPSSAASSGSPSKRRPPELTEVSLPSLPPSRRFDRSDAKHKHRPSRSEALNLLQLARGAARARRASGMSLACLAKGDTAAPAKPVTRSSADGGACADVSGLQQQQQQPQLDAAQAQLEHSVAEKAKTIVDVDRKRPSLHGTVSGPSTPAGECAAAKMEVAKLTMDMHHLQRQLEEEREAARSRERALEERAARLDDERQVLEARLVERVSAAGNAAQTKLVEAEAKAAASGREVADLRSQADELKKSLDTLKRDLDEACLDRQAVCVERDSLVVRCEDGRVEMEDLSNQCVALRSTIARLEAEQRDLQGSSEQEALLQEEEKQRQSEGIRKLQRERDSLLKRVEELAEAQASPPPLQKQDDEAWRSEEAALEALRSELSAAREAARGVTRDLEEEQASSRQVRQQLKAKQCEAEALRVREGTLRASVDSLQQELESARKDRRQRMAGLLHRSWTAVAGAATHANVVDTVHRVPPQTYNIAELFPHSEDGSREQAAVKAGGMRIAETSNGIVQAGEGMSRQIPQDCSQWLPAAGGSDQPDRVDNVPNASLEPTPVPISEQLPDLAEIVGLGPDSRGMLPFDANNVACTAEHCGGQVQADLGSTDACSRTHSLAAQPLQPPQLPSEPSMPCDDREDQVHVMLGQVERDASLAESLCTESASNAGGGSGPRVAAALSHGVAPSTLDTTFFDELPLASADFSQADAGRSNEVEGAPTTNGPPGRRASTDVSCLFGNEAPQGQVQGNIAGLFDNVGTGSDDWMQSGGDVGQECAAFSSSAAPAQPATATCCLGGEDGRKDDDEVCRSSARGRPAIEGLVSVSPGLTCGLSAPTRSQVTGGGSALTAGPSCGSTSISQHQPSASRQHVDLPDNRSDGCSSYAPGMQHPCGDASALFGSTPGLPTDCSSAPAGDSTDELFEHVAHDKAAWQGMQHDVKDAAMLFPDDPPGSDASGLFGGPPVPRAEGDTSALFGASSSSSGPCHHVVDTVDASSFFESLGSNDAAAVHAGELARTSGSGCSPPQPMLESAAAATTPCGSLGVANLFETDSASGCAKDVSSLF